MLPLFVSLALAVLPSQTAPPQEKPVDSGSSRITITGCLNGKNLIAVEPVEDRPVQTVVEPGRRFRLSGPKAVMKELSTHDKTVVEVTGLVRKDALDPAAQGMPIGAGGRIRIGGMPTNTDPTRNPQRDPLASVDIMDVESFRSVDGVCPKG